MIFDIAVRGPDSADHNGDTLSSIGRLDTKPKHSEDSSGHNSKVRKVVTEGGPNSYGEGDVQLSTNSTIENLKRKKCQ